MQVRLLASVAVAASLYAGSALADAYPPINACQLYAMDLRQDMALATAWNPNYAAAEAALAEGKHLCAKGQPAEGIAVLVAGIEALGVPVRDR